MRLSVTAAVSLALVSLGVAQQSSASARIATHIPAQSLSQALQTLAKDRGFQIVYMYNDLRNARTAGAVGEFTADEALERLLTGTGFSYRYLDDKTVTVWPTSPGQSTNSRNTRPERASERESELVPAEAMLELSGVGDSEQAMRLRLSLLGTDATASAQSQSSESGAPLLEEVVVTSRRREESEQTVPISLSVFSQHKLDDLHIEDIRDLVNFTPGLYMTPPAAQGTGGASASYNLFTIRGIESNGNSPTTQIYMDETPMAQRVVPFAGGSGSPQPLIFDLDRVEVLRGPQGTLFGASAMGGAVRFITKQPSLTEYSGYAKAELSFTASGSPNHDMGVAVGGPIITDSLGFRVSAEFEDRGGFIDQVNPFTGVVTRPDANTQDNYVVHAAVTWAPSADLTITPTVHIQHNHHDNPDSVWLTDLPASELRKATGDAYSPYSDSFGVGSLAIKYRWDDLTLQSDTSYLWRSFNATNDLTSVFDFFLIGAPVPVAAQSIPAIFGHNAGYTHEFQQEFRISSPDTGSRWNWIAGAFYRFASYGITYGEDSLTPVTEYLNEGTESDVFGCCSYLANGKSYDYYAYTHVSEVNTAAFGDIDYNLTPKLKLAAGVRVERSIVKDLVTGQAGAGLGDLHDPGNIVYSPEERETPVTPRFSATWQYDPNQMVYASVAKGYRSGGPSGYAKPQAGFDCTADLASYGFSSPPLSYKSDNLWSYEVGSKGSFFNDHIVFDGSAYYILWNRLQQGLRLTRCNEFITANLGKAVSRGFDAQLSINVMRGLTMNFVVGYTDAYYPDTLYTSPDANGNRSLIYRAGDPISPYADKPWSYAISGDYTVNMGEILKDARAYIHTDFHWQSAAQTLTPPPPGADPLYNKYVDPSFGVLNIRLGLKLNGFDLSLFSNNALNADPLVAFHDFVPAFYNLQQISRYQPRTIGLTGFYRF